MAARIFQPAKTAMQSGKAKSRQWILEFEPEAARETDPLMGWTSSGDMRQQLRLKFDTLEEARSYAQRTGIAFYIQQPRKMKPKRMSYADNFRWGRDDNWTH